MAEPGGNKMSSKQSQTEKTNLERIYLEFSTFIYLNYTK